jgi:hypothetical protein
LVTIALVAHEAHAASGHALERLAVHGLDGLVLALVDLSEAAVGPPPAPLLDGWGDLEVAREAGRRLEITYLQADDVADQFAVLRRCGQETRRLLGV